MKTKMTSLPFSISRSSRKSLTEQVYCGMRNAILSGFFKPGDVLPARETLASALGVSEIVTREAGIRLANDGYVNPRPGVGSIVLAGRERLWRGRVLYVVSDIEGSYYADVVGGELRDALARCGYLVQRTSVATFPTGVWDFGVLDQLLHDQVDLAVLMHGDKIVARHLSDARVPFLAVMHRDCRLPCCRGVLKARHHACLPRIVGRCLDMGVRRVLLAWAWGQPSETLAALKKAGIEAECVRLCKWTKEGHIEEFQRNAVKWFLDRFSMESASWPDLVWFPDDDFLAAGALTALLSLGIRIPEDVRLLAFANRRLGPVYVKPLSRIEIDPIVHGRQLAEWARLALEGRPLPADAHLGTRYVQGETF